MADLSTVLFDSPFKDYTIISSDGREIQVHKCVLYAFSDYFKLALTNTQELFTNTEFGYDDLLNVIRWMYGFKVQLTISSYDIADKFIISELLTMDWKKYIHIDDVYAIRFSSIMYGKLSPSTLEDKYYGQLYNAVVYHVCTTKYKFDRTEMESLYELHIDVLESWFTSRYRLACEYYLAYFIWMYTDAYPSKYEEIKDRLFPHINFNIMTIEQHNYSRIVYAYYNGSCDGFEQKSAMNSITTRPPTYAFISGLLFKHWKGGYYTLRYKSYKKYYEMYSIRVNTEASLEGSIELNKLFKTDEEYDDYVKFVHSRFFAEWCKYST